MKTQSELKALVERARAFHLARRGEGMLHRTIELDVDRAKPLDPNGEGGGADDVRLDIALSSEAPVFTLTVSPGFLPRSAAPRAVL